MRILPFLSFAAGIAAQLPPVPVPPENPLTPAKVVLGKALFWEEQLSHDDTIACGTCHVPEAGGSDPRLNLPLTPVHPGADGLLGTADDIHGSPGVARRDANDDFQPDPTFGFGVQVTRRFAATNHAAAYHAMLFWDGRASTRFVDPETGTVAIQFDGALESQAVGPIRNEAEMGIPGRTWNDVRQKLQTVQPLRLATQLPPDLTAALQQHPTYPGLFADAFGDPAITAQRIAFALASYQRTLIPDRTPWDDWQAGNTAALTANQQLGLSIFMGQGRCQACHIPPLFTDDTFHNLGLRPWTEDPGLMNVNGLFWSRGEFKTPTLRNAGLRQRGMHDGSMPQLGTASPNDPSSMINLYLVGGGQYRENLDPWILDLRLYGVTYADLQLVEDFIRVGLTDPRAAQGLPPFDHPRLRGLSLPPPRHFGQPLAFGSEPGFADTAPPFPGNARWQLGLFGGQPGGTALLAYALRSSEPALLLGQIPLHLSPALDFRLFALGGTGTEPGHTTWRLGVPNDAALLLRSVYFQLFTTDSASPLGIASSRGVEFVIR